MDIGWCHAVRQRREHIADALRLIAGVQQPFDEFDCHKILHSAGALRRRNREANVRFGSAIIATL